MRKIANFLWLVLFGWEQALIFLVAAGVFAITIVGLPIARACVEFAKLSAFPFGKVIVRDSAISDNVSVIVKVFRLILNVLWFPVGLALTIMYYALGVMAFVTILYIPVGLVYFKMAKFILFPIGARVVVKGEMER